ncbi:MAG: hypothetical protein IT193_01775 [Propionibacteriaceae bacterium]|nr:hypothetical protein [Propionibacteriaceae bacterium]
MAAKRLPPPPAGAEEDRLVPFNMRMPESILAALDAWVDDLNRGRTLGKVTRSDVIRALLIRGARERPDLESK